jgi:hypothetical protein
MQLCEPVATDSKPRRDESQDFQIASLVRSAKALALKEIAKKGLSPQRM